MDNHIGATASAPPPWKRSVAFALCLPVALLSGCGGGTGDLQGTITGLTASGLVLSDGADTLSVAAGSTSFSFSTVLDENDSYAVTVTTQPTGLSCSVTNGSGTVSADSTISVAVACTPVYSVSGTITGLKNSGLFLGDGTDSIAVDANAASFAFRTPLAQGAPYTIEVTTQPSGQTCTVGRTGTVAGGTVADGTVTGTVDGAAVTDIVVTCTG